MNPRGWLKAEPWMPLGAVGLATLLSRRHEVSFVDEERFGGVGAEVIEDADVVCITGMSHQAEGIRLWASRARLMGKWAIIGGVHATLSDDTFEEATVVVGPGERVIGEMVDKPGRWSSRHWALPLMSPDAYPWPDREMFRWGEYRERMGGLPAIRVVGARGCPFRCKFCCNRELTGGKMKHRLPHEIEAEIRDGIARLGIKAVLFAMSAFTVNKTWAAGMSSRLGRLGVKWKATTRVDLVNREVLRAMKDGGCAGLGFGVESGDDAVLRVIGKGTTVAQAREAFAMCREVGLPTWAMFMTHVPGETPGSLRRTRMLAEELAPPLGATFQRFSPLPGSEFWGRGLEKWGRTTVDRQAGGFGQVGFVPAAFDREAR